MATAGVIDAFDAALVEQSVQPLVSDIPADVVAESSHEEDAVEASDEQHKERGHPRFNRKTLIRYLNECYGERFLFKDGEKLLPEQAKGKVIIDLNKYSALDELRFVMYSIDMCNKKLPRKERWDMITHSLFDFKLRGILTAINDNELSTEESRKYKEKDYKLLMDKIVPQLHFDAHHPFSMDEVKEDIAKYLRSQSIRYKLLNKLFPHPSNGKVVDDKKVGAFVDKLYIQTMSKYHDLFIKHIFTAKSTAWQELFAIACKQLETANKLEKDFLLKYDWESFKTTKHDKDLLPVLRQACAERNICQKYSKYFATVGLDEALYGEYKRIAGEFIKLATVVKDTPVASYKDFVAMIIKVFKAVDEPLHYGKSIIAFMKDAGVDKKAVFTTKFRQVLNDLIRNDDIVVNYSGNMFMCNLQRRTKTGVVSKPFEGEVIQEHKYVPKQVFNTLTKIGLFVECKDARSDISCGIGCAIVDHIREEAEKHYKADQKMHKNIFIVC